jgi:hypothetical protein
MATLISEYVHKPSNRRETSGWKASLLEKVWLLLMALALTVAAINTAADGSGIGESEASTPLKSVLVDLVVR